VHVKDFDGRSSFATWLTRIAINSAVMILRKKRPGRELSVDSFADKNESGTTWEISDPTPGPETQYVEEEQRRLLWEAISELRPSIRKVVEFQLARDCAMKETANRIGISLFAAKSRLFHAKAAIRKSMKRSTIGGAPLLRTRTRPRFVDGTAAYRKIRAAQIS
jgi:RNA polymerase sigma-70 factor (ECF subfamily)